MTTAWFIGVAIIVGLILLALIRMIKGPSAADRVVSLDAINTLIVGAMILLGAAFDQVLFIDVAIVYTLLSFVGTLYISRYLGGKQA